MHSMTALDWLGDIQVRAYPRRDLWPPLFRLVHDGHVNN